MTRVLSSHAAAGGFGSCPVDLRPPAEGRCRAGKLADVFRLLQELALQRARSDQPRERAESESRVGLPDAHQPSHRGDPDGGRWRDVSERAAFQCVRARCRHRPAVLALQTERCRRKSMSAATQVNRGVAVLGDRVFRGHHGCASGRAQREDRCGSVGCAGRRLQYRLQHHRRAADRERYGDHRHRRRRVRRPRVPRRV